MCPDRTQCKQGFPDAPDAGSMLGEPGRNTNGSDAGHLFADASNASQLPSSPGTLRNSFPASPTPFLTQETSAFCRRDISTPTPSRVRQDRNLGRRLCTSRRHPYIGVLNQTIISVPHGREGVLLQPLHPVQELLGLRSRRPSMQIERSCVPLVFPQPHPCPAQMP